MTDIPTNRPLETALPPDRVTRFYADQPDEIEKYLANFYRETFGVDGNLHPQFKRVSIAHISGQWRLHHDHYYDLVVLEIESIRAGTASEVTAWPMKWGGLSEATLAPIFEALLAYLDQRCKPANEAAQPARASTSAGRQEFIVKPAPPKTKAQGGRCKDWIDYYHACLDAELKTTLLQLATKSGFSEGRLKHLHEGCEVCAKIAPKGAVNST